MLTIADYLEMDGLALTEGMRRGDFSPVEVLDCAIARAEAVNPSLNAIICECFERARDVAATLSSQSLRQSNLAGLPLLIKDLADVAGLPTTSGSRLFEGFVAKENAAIVDRYVAAGMVIFGKTNTPEKGLVITTEPVATGATRNPWHLEHSAGGSSGGAAAAVAAGISPLAHATDGGGSIRIPASCCGLVGLKPSRGLTVVEDSLAACWSGMSVGHAVSQTVRDSAAMLDLICLDEPALFPLAPRPESFLEGLERAPGKLRIGLQLNHPVDQALDAQCIEAVRRAGELCVSLGHEVEEIEHPVDYQAAISAMARIINLHVYQALAPRLDELNLSIDEAPVEASTRIMAGSGSKVLASTYVAALDTVNEAARQTAEFHRHWDVLLSPVLSMPPVPLGWLDMNSADMKQYSARFKQYSGFTALYNGTGQPSLSLPLHRSDKGLPIGVMFSAAWGRDELLLRLARQLEQAQPWPRRAPEPFVT